VPVNNPAMDWASATAELPAISMNLPAPGAEPPRAQPPDPRAAADPHAQPGFVGPAPTHRAQREGADPGAGGPPDISDILFAEAHARAQRAAGLPVDGGPASAADDATNGSGFSVQPVAHERNGGDAADAEEGDADRNGHRDDRTQPIEVIATAAESGSGPANRSFRG
jgi:hypothetical protein